MATGVGRDDSRVSQNGYGVGWDGKGVGWNGSRAGRGDNGIGTKKHK